MPRPWLSRISDAAVERSFHIVEPRPARRGGLRRSGNRIGYRAGRRDLARYGGEQSNPELIYLALKLRRVSRVTVVPAPAASLAPEGTARHNRGAPHDVPWKERTNGRQAASFGCGLRHGWFGPLVSAARGFTPAFWDQGQRVLDLLPRSPHELPVLLAALNRSGLWSSFPA